MIPTVKGIPYEQRLKRRRLATLSKRRKRYDIIETCKVIHRHTKLNSKELFQSTDENTDAGK